MATLEVLICVLLLLLFIVGLLNAAPVIYSSRLLRGQLKTGDNLQRGEPYASQDLARQADERHFRLASTPPFLQGVARWTRPLLWILPILIVLVLAAMVVTELR